MNNFKNRFKFFKTLFNQRNILWTLVIRDFKSRYLSSYIGLPWAFIQPTVYIFVVWFAFTFGLRGGGTTASGYPFAVFLMSGLIPWLFISKTMIISCSAISEYSYLIKKTEFPVVMIPVIKVLSGMLVHFVILAVFMLLLIFAYGVTPSIYWLQVFYYQFVMLFLLVGIGLFVSSVNVFVKDMGHFINVIVTMLFWATPIIWPFAMLGGNYRYIALFNPFFYITEGYRYTFLQNKWFFEFTEMNILFWSVSISIFVLGIYTFQRLRPRFGDVL